MNPRELILRKTIPVVINSFNQPTYLENIIYKFKKNEFKNIIVLDNKSTSQSLLCLYKLLEIIGVTIIYYGHNYGPRYFHINRIHQQILDNIPHIFTDPDIDFNVLNENFLSELIDTSNKYMNFKVGCALELPTPDEMKPDIFYRDSTQNNRLISITEWESQFWLQEIEAGIYNSPVDTTLHLFNPLYFESNSNYISGLRIAKDGFQVKHLPWFKSDLISDFEKNYYKSTDLSGWSNY